MNKIVTKSNNNNITFYKDSIINCIQRNRWTIFEDKRRKYFKIEKVLNTNANELIKINWSFFYFYLSNIYYKYNGCFNKYTNNETAFENLSIKTFRMMKVQYMNYQSFYIFLLVGAKLLSNNFEGNPIHLKKNSRNSITI